MLKLLIALAAVMPLLAQNATVLRIVPSSAGIGEARWYDADASHYVGFKSKATVSTSVLWSLPNADGAASECLVTDGSLSLSFAACAAGSTPPFSDANPIIKDNLDATKELLFSIGGFTASTQRTVTVPDASFIMAGRDVDNNFSALQSFQSGIDNAPSGGSGNAVKTRVLRVYQDSSTTVHWFFETPTSNTFRLKANDGLPALTFDTSTAESLAILADNTASSGVRFHLIPGSTAGTQTLGQSGTPWGSLYLKTALVHNGTTRIDSSGNINGASFGVGGGTVITSASRWNLDLMPAADNVHALGGPSLRWNSADITNLTVASCTGCGSGALPVSDSTSIVKDNGDATKEVRIEASGISTGTVRVWTAPNANITVAGINLAQTWTAVQTFGGGAYIDTAGNFNIPGMFNSGDLRLSSSGVFNGASYNVAGTEVISSGRIGKFVSLDINGTSNVIDSSRNATVLSLTVNGAYGITSGGDASLDNIVFTSMQQGFTTRWDSSGNINVASMQVAGTTRVTSGGVGQFVSVDVNGTSNVIDSSRNASFVSLTINGTLAINSSRNADLVNLKFTGQPWWPVTDDNSWTPSGTTTAKLYVYDSSGAGIGWIPIYP